jgi:YegS/Rv2252/BmrU family lipid kinase
MKYTFLVNPAAQSGQANKIWQSLATYLVTTSLTYDVRISEKPGDIRKWAYQIRKRELADDHIVVVVGGDGSLNEAVNGALDLEPGDAERPMLPLAYIPAGSGNDFARAHQLATDPLQRLKRIVDLAEQGGRPELLDIGQYSEALKRERRFFVNNVGIGFDATTVAAANSSVIKPILNKLKLGKMVYGLAVLKTLATQDRFQVEVKPGNGPQKHIYKGYLVTVSNHPYFGGGIKIMPDAEVSDGQLDLVIVEQPSFWRFALIFSKILMKKPYYQYPEVHRWTAPAINLKISRLEFGHADGEELGSRAYDLYLTSMRYPFWI